MLNKLSSLRAQGVSEEGFTLIELIIVVVIIGILSAIAIPIFLNQQKSAIAAGVKSDVRNTNTNIATALVKQPTASVVGAGTLAAPTGAYTKAGGTTIPVGSATAQAVISDAATELTVGGTWQGYTIIGENDGVNGTYTFNSTTGDYVGSANSDYA